MTRSRTLYYLALLGVALAAPMLFDFGGDVPASTAQAQQGEELQKAEPTHAVPTQPPAPRAPVDRKQRLNRQILSTIETDTFTAQVTNLNTAVARVDLKTERYAVDGKPINVVTTGYEEFLPLAFELAGVSIGPDTVWKATQLSDRGVRYDWVGDGVAVTRKLEAGQGPYQLWATTTVKNRSDAPRVVGLRTSTHHYVEREAEEGAIPLLPVRPPALSNGLCKHAEDVEREMRSDLPDVSAPLVFKGGVRFAGIENAYFLNAIAAGDAPAERCSISASDRGLEADGEPVGSLIGASLVQPSATIPPGGVHSFRTLAYLGPKTPTELQAAGHSLKDAIDTGWFSALAELLTSLLRMIYELIGNWGVSIILLTFIVKAVLYPLTAKQMQSMARMKELKPEMDRINELYADDREKKGAAIMEMYRKEGVNPMAGCFPMLLQLPIWFSLYTSLSTNVELFRAPFALWLTDLSQPDPVFFLPVALGVLMFVQQKMTPATGGDPLQQKMMLYMMPAMITSFMLFLPTGLCLYMFTNSALSIGQQRLIEAQLKAASGQPKDDKDPPSNEPSEAGSEPPPAAVIPKTSRPSKAERRSRRGK